MIKKSEAGGVVLEKNTADATSSQKKTNEEIQREVSQQRKLIKM